MNDAGLLDEVSRLRGDAEIARLRLQAAHAEVERLRLTDAEREALEYGIRQADEYDRVGLEDAKRAAIVFRGLLTRTGGTDG